MMKTSRLNRMLHGQLDAGFVRFKYYGDFDTMKKIHNDCKDDLSYIGNSNIDASPVFVYYYNNIDIETIRNFKSLNLVLRKIKIKHYTKKSLSKKEQSLLTFFKFFMVAYDNLEIKGLRDFEIKEFDSINYEL